MQKILLPLLFVMVCITQGNAQQKLFDQSVQLKSCSISIEANAFIATTLVEMEFYNPKDQEVEGYQTFELNRGQVITNFQLELNGKYRDGSIEERWKANNAYSRIVGKRIDPAILQMDWQNHYSLRIYPVPAKSSRKISFTITQMMEEDSSKLTYNLPLNFQNKTTDFKLDIKVNDPVSTPFGNKGLLHDQVFDLENGDAVFKWQTKNITLDKPVSFSINQLERKPQICISKENRQAVFVMRISPDMPLYTEVKPQTLAVFWDVSKSAKQRDFEKELDFLEKYIKFNGIKTTTIRLFNHQLLESLNYETGKDNFYITRNFLLNYSCTGATELGNLDLLHTTADAILLFTDGYNSIGNNLPKTGAVQVSCIASSSQLNYSNLQSIVGTSGGAVIDLKNVSLADAVKKIDKAENYLMGYKGNGFKVNEKFPIKLGKTIFLSGQITQPGNLQLFYGNNGAINKTENIFLSDNETYSPDLYKTIKMLKSYDSLMYNNYYTYWQNLVVFGLTEKVVTPQTSYLVLERIEDYINYKIAPPKELEEKCAEMNYVYKSEYKIQALKTFTEQEALQTAVNNYNVRIRWWDKNAPLIDLTKPVEMATNAGAANPSETKTVNSSASSALVNSQDLTVVGKNNLSEVVVTTAMGVKRTARMTSTNVQVINGEQLNTIRGTDLNNALAGKVSGLQVRSQSAVSLGSTSAIRLRGESSLGSGAGVLYVVDGTVLSNPNDINLDDIEDVTVLQGPNAAALFGSDGANGAIVINSKKAKRNYGNYNRWSEYHINSAEDEEYMIEIRKASPNDRWETYLDLEEEKNKEPGFYFDMADFFFDKGMKKEATAVLYNAIELCNGTVAGLKAAAYLLESKKEFDFAIQIYVQLIRQFPDDLTIQRDLALAYFQKGDCQEAVNTYYTIITKGGSQYYYERIKELSIAEMNAVIAGNRSDLDLSKINPNLIRPLPLDLRIEVESNDNYINNLRIVEPGGAIADYNSNNTKNGGNLGGGFNRSYYYNYYYRNNEYVIKNARAGKYRIKVDAYNNYSYAGKIPSWIRIIVFKNFNTEGQIMEVQNVIMDNQYGVVEIGDVKW